MTPCGESAVSVSVTNSIRADRPVDRCPRQYAANGDDWTSSFFSTSVCKRAAVVYDVVDGKQRLETILMFTRQGRSRRRAFEAKLGLNGDVDHYTGNPSAPSILNRTTRFSPTRCKPLR